MFSPSCAEGRVWDPAMALRYRFKVAPRPGSGVGDKCRPGVGVDIMFGRNGKPSASRRHLLSHVGTRLVLYRVSVLVSLSVCTRCLRRGRKAATCLHMLILRSHMVSGDVYARITVPGASAIACDTSSDISSVCAGTVICSRTPTAHQKAPGRRILR